MAKYLDGTGLSKAFELIKSWCSSTFAPISHASSSDTYGKGTDANYGHVKLSDSATGTSAAASDGTAATPKAVAAALASANTYTDTALGGLDTGVIGVKGNAESTYRTGNVNLTPANIGAAPSSHAHGNITSGGDITATAPTVASGDKLIINDESESKITNGPSFGSDTTKYLRNDGSWAVPTGESNVQSDWNQDDTTADDYIKNKPTITDTKNTTGSLENANKLFVVGAMGQMDHGQTYSNAKIFMAPNGHLFSHSQQVVNLSDNQDLTNKTYNGYTLGEACAKAIGSVAEGDTGLVTGDAVADAIAALSEALFDALLEMGNNINDAFQDLQAETAGALVYKGVAANAAAISGASYEKGWYWIASGTFALTSSINVEPGDMIIAKQDKTSTFANDIDVIQTNIDTLTTAEVTALWNAA